jgi:hypothetical protein
MNRLTVSATMPAPTPYAAFEAWRIFRTVLDRSTQAFAALAHSSNDG